MSHSAPRTHCANDDGTNLCWPFIYLARESTQAAELSFVDRVSKESEPFDFGWAVWGRLGEMGENVTLPCAVLFKTV